MILNPTTDIPLFDATKAAEETNRCRSRITPADIHPLRNEPYCRGEESIGRPDEEMEGDDQWLK